MGCGPGDSVYRPIDSAQKLLPSIRLANASLAWMKLAESRGYSPEMHRFLEYEKPQGEISLLLSLETSKNSQREDSATSQSA